MKRNIPRCIVLCVLFAAGSLAAYDRPEKTADGVGIALHGLEEPYEPSNKWIRVTRHASEQPLAFSVTLTNRTAYGVSGELRIAMTDDWSVSEEGFARVRLPPFKAQRYRFSALARTNVVAGLYPVHATLKRPDCEPLSVVSVFQAHGAKPHWNHVLPDVPVPADEKGLLADDVVLSVGVRTFAWRGIRCRVDGQKPEIVRVERRTDANGDMEIIHVMRHPRQGEVPLRARLRRLPENMLCIAWDMPGVTRQPDGTPRYTHLSLGAGESVPFRVYAGLGNVLENPTRFSLHAEAVRAGTRFTGCDYANGVSLVQATDVFPDRVVCDRDARLLSQVVHGDATFTLVPSTNGAFAAARRYADVCGYAKSAGHDALVGRMCLDSWGGDYAVTARELEAAARYGVTQAVFVKHVWQRYGYDYRLPDISPPAGNLDTFRAMVAAAQHNGMLFCPHDNYTDIYPDSDAFSYDVVRFKANGEPMTAWLNPGRNALSYKWLDHAILPFVARNAAAMARSFAPDGVFIDVLASQPPVDHYDRAGNYCDKACSVRAWNAAFDTYRRELGKPCGPMISETGHDALVGHVDAGEADHMGGEVWMDATACRVHEKVPWEDMVTHGRMILFAGGLASRYAMSDWGKPGNEALHGYGSDDYMGFTVLAGRQPMCEGPFSRAAVMTYWLTHDICAALGRARFEEHAFVDGSIRHQRTRFAQGGSVWANRDATADWWVAGHVLPPFGFWAVAPNVTAAVVRLEGQRVAFAKTPDSWFVDARPRPRDVGRLFVAAAHPTHFKAEGEKRGRIMLDWQDRAMEKGDGFFGSVSWRNAKGKRSTSYEAVRASRHELLIRLPADALPGVYDVRYGLTRGTQPDNPRLPIASENVYGYYQRDGLQQISAGRVRYEPGKPLSWESPSVENAEQERRLEINTARRILDFGGLATDGAFRLTFQDAWRITPLPGSNPFTVRLDLAALNAHGRRIAEVVAINPEATATPPRWTQQGDVLTLDVDARAFAYRIK